MPKTEFRDVTQEEIQKAFGKRLKKLRKSTGLSAENFSIKINMARPLYRSYEEGRGNITIKNQVKIMNGLGITFEEFFSGEGFDGK